MESLERRYLAAPYPVVVEESQVALPEELSSIDSLTSDLEGESDWYLVALTGGPNVGS